VPERTLVHEPCGRTAKKNGRLAERLQRGSSTQRNRQYAPNHADELLSGKQPTLSKPTWKIRHSGGPKTGSSSDRYRQNGQLLFYQAMINANVCTTSVLHVAHALSNPCFYLKVLRLKYA
jgi:hypothetical protein